LQSRRPSRRGRSTGDAAPEQLRTGEPTATLQLEADGVVQIQRRGIVDQRQAQRKDASDFRSVKLQLLYVDACPGATALLPLLTGYAQEVGADFEPVLVRTHDEAVAHDFPGSPTVRVDGRDVDQRRADAGPGLGCRLYWTGQGITNAPPLSWVVAAIDRATP
jgi:hypothetical protein